MKIPRQCCLIFLGIKETALFIEGYNIVPHLLLGGISPVTEIK